MPNITILKKDQKRRFAQTLRAVAEFTSPDEHRPMLTLIKITTDDAGLIFEATDSYRLLRLHYPLNERCELETPVLVHGRRLGRVFPRHTEFTNDEIPLVVKLRSVGKPDKPGQTGIGFDYNGVEAMLYSTEDPATFPNFDNLMQDPDLHPSMRVGQVTFGSKVLAGTLKALAPLQDRVSDSVQFNMDKTPLKPVALIPKLKFGSATVLVMPVRDPALTP